jgi:hypothetical protein
MSEELAGDSQGKIVVFGAKRIRRAWVDDQWYFSVVDIIAALTDSPNARDYWYRMKRREMESSGVELSTLCRQLKLTAADGKAYKTDCVNTEAAFRVIQSIPSPKAEPFKQWLASVGYQRVQEIENPELAQQRMRELYKEKGTSCVRSGTVRCFGKFVAYPRDYEAMRAPFGEHLTVPLRTRKHLTVFDAEHRRSASLRARSGGGGGQVLSSD